MFMGSLVSFGHRETIFVIVGVCSPNFT